MTKAPALYLRPGRDGPFRGGHPWVFSGALQTPSSQLEAGDAVAVRTARGDFVAWGIFNPGSQIQVRLYSWDETTTLTPHFWSTRIHASIQRRLGLPHLPRGNSARLVFSEADGLSGLVVDRFGEWVSVQITALGLMPHREVILDTLEEALAPRGIRLSTVAAPEEEGLGALDEVARGESPPGPVLLQDGPIQIHADLRAGQKTGHYLDQAENRVRVAAWMEGRSMADLYCYTGGFALHAAKAGAASVTGVDSSAPALELAARNAQTNGLSGSVAFHRSDVRAWLRARAGQPRAIQGMVLDPPRFATSRRGVGKALKAYRDLHADAFAVLAPDAILATFSCSGRVDRSAFVESVAQGARMAGRVARIVEVLGHPADHPVALNCPETEYLKGVILQVD